MKSYVKYYSSMSNNNNKENWNITDNGNQTCQPMTHWSGCYHHVRVSMAPQINGTLPNRYLYFMVGNGEQWRDQVFQLLLPRRSPTVDQKNGQVLPLQSIWYGDMGVGADAEITMNSILKYNQKYGKSEDGTPLIDALFHVGDIAYSDAKNNETWYEFMDLIEPLSTSWIYMTTPGNHDSFNNMETYLQTFHMPHNGEYYVLRNLFDKVATIVSLSTEQAIWPFSKQSVWMVEQLEALNHDAATKWLILYIHKPLYCSNEWDYCKLAYLGLEREEIKYSISYLIQKFNVHLVIAGHTHAYERSYPVYLDSVKGTYEKPCAPVHIYAGAPGSYMPLDIEWQTAVPQWSAKRFSELGWGLLKIYNTTDLEWQYVSSDTLQVLDSIHLKRNDFSRC